MPDDIKEVLYADAIVEGLSSPSSSDAFRALHGNSPEVVAAIAVKRALEGGGGGGGSLPAWWTVDSSPGAESVQFAGFVEIAPTQNTLDVLAVIQAPAGYLANSGSGDLLHIVGEDATVIHNMDVFGTYYLTAPAGQNDAGVNVKTVDGGNDSIVSLSTKHGIVVKHPVADGDFLHITDPNVGDYLRVTGGRNTFAKQVEIAPADLSIPGLLLAAIVSAPDNANLDDQDLTFWFDSTNGAAKLKIVAKTNDGTVVTGQVALS